MKFVLVHSNDIELVQRYLPDNYFVFFARGSHTVIAGEDDHGWTAEGYVIPRLQSAVIACELITPQQYADRFMINVLRGAIRDKQNKRI